MATVVNPERFFLERFDLGASGLDRVLGTAVATRADHADLFFEYRVAQTASLEDGVVKKATRNVRQGVGVRVLAGARQGYAYTDEVSLDQLEVAARTARYIAEHRADAAVPVHVAGGAPHDLYAVTPAPVETPIGDLAALLARLDSVARAYDPAVTQVLASIGIEHRVILVATPDGRMVGDVRPLVHLSVSCIAERGGVRQQGSHGGGGRFAFSELVGRAEAFAHDAARQAVTNLDAVPAPAGTMTVVLGPGWPGILLHEAVGHGLEGDFNRKGTSAFSNRIGTKVASDLCTVVDDGTIAAARLAQRRRRRRRPCFRGRHPARLQDKQNDADGMPLTGNGRRELLAPTDAAHDEHVHARRRRRARGHPALGRSRALRRLVRRRQRRHHERQVRVLGERGVRDRGRQDRPSGQGRDARRQRARRADAHHARRPRPGARRRHRHLRQGRSIRPGRRRPRPSTSTDHRRRDAGLTVDLRRRPRSSTARRARGRHRRDRRRAFSRWASVSARSEKRACSSATRPRSRRAAIWLPAGSPRSSKTRSRSHA
jgi:TldD protein